MSGSSSAEGEVEEGFGDEFEQHRAGAAERQGRRPTMEDAHVCEVFYEHAPGNSGLYGVFDGHGGQQTAKFVAANIGEELGEHDGLMEGDLAAAFKDVFASLDSKIIAKMIEEGWADGSTGAVCFTDSRTNKIHTANIGDSEVLVLRREDGGDGITPILLSTKHKPSDAEEKRRIEAAGGHVVFGRVLGNLAVARAFGDKDFKFPQNKGSDHFVSNLPSVSEHLIQPSDEILVIACDGMFEKLDYQAVADCIWKARQETNDPTDTASAAVNRAYESGSLDNISCVVVFLR